MTDLTVSDVALISTAVSTIVLAGATYLVVRETRSSRLEAAEARIRTSLRGAVAEQLENLRRLSGADPGHGRPAIDRLTRAEPDLVALADVVREVDVPGELAVYLIWMQGQIRDDWTELRTAAGRALDENEIPANLQNQTRAWWDVIVERIQVVACLLGAEAARRGHAAEAEALRRVTWTIPHVWPDAQPRIGTRVIDDSRRGAPPFPAGEDYAACDIPARDERAAKAAHAVQDEFYGSN